MCPIGTPEERQPGNQPVNERPQSGWIIFFGEDWGRLNSTGQHLTRALLRDFRVLWVNSLGLRRPRLSFADAWRAIQKLGTFVISLAVPAGKPDAGLPEGLIIVKPIAIPFWGSKFVRRVNRWLVSRTLNRYVEHFDIRRPLVVSACPASADLMALGNPSRTIYYCADEYSELYGMDSSVVSELEDSLLAVCDEVVVVSKELMRRKQKLHPRVRYLPHGVDFALLSTAATNPGQIADNLATIPTPRVGYVGLIGKQLDVALIDEVMASRPDISFVFIGPKEANSDWEPRAPNAYWLGSRQYSDLPSYLCGLGICILPWNDSERNRNANPTKLREYLAAGCLVVATEHPEIDPSNEFVIQAKSASEFLQALEMQLERLKNVDRLSVSQSVADQTWAHRAATLVTRGPHLRHESEPGL